jgi:hypothetical protein
LEHLSNAPRCRNHAQTSPHCWQCMNQGKMRKVLTYSFSNIQNSSQDATHVQMSKLDTLQVHNDLNYMISKFHNHCSRLKRIWAILQKVTLSWAKSYIWAKHVKMAKPHKTHARTTILIVRPSQKPTSTSCHVKATEPCAYFYIWDFSLVGIMQRFSTQSKLNLAHFPSNLHFIFRFLFGKWNVFATKKNLCLATR